MPEVEAPEGSGYEICAFGSGVCFGLVPEVDGVGVECGLLVVGEPLESELGGETGGSAGTGGAAGGLALTSVFVGPKGCNLGTVVQLYWNSGMVSSSPVRNL